MSLSRMVFTSALLVALSGCEQDPGAKLAEGVFAPLGEILPIASAEQRATFARGKQVALHRFTPEEGLGPVFNSVSCTSCHERPTTGGSGARYRNFLLVGTALPDGSFTPTGVNGVQDHFDLDHARNPSAEANVVATRNPTPLFGVGLLAELTDEAILANADPDDADGDGISGRPNYDRGFVGRFGRKSQTVSIEGFIRGPIFNHMGITSNPLTNERKNQLPVPSGNPVAIAQGALGAGGVDIVIAAQAAAPDEPNQDDDGVPDPELAEQDLFDVVSFAMLLAAPQPDPPTALTEAGSRTFADIGCTGCHVRTLKGPRGLLPLYSDLLLHDMGPGLDDAVVMKVATGSEFRTQPLWGVAAVAPYLHDGRADTIDDAIRYHGGEAQRARDAYVALSAVDRQALLAFIDSLGGKSQASGGLLHPAASVPDVGSYGGPEYALSDAQRAAFVRGRALFDRDMAIGAGLGPQFNGDSCRSCHADPVIGGAGGLDVDVTRQGIFDFTSGVFTAPANGTMAHRFATEVNRRPAIDAACNYFEARQTPALFGLGLVDRIPEASIVANADPDDADGDGVRGRPHLLADGRLGRLGWKADVPSLAEFLRDAMANEVGMTLPAAPGLTFGLTSDGDAAADPELSEGEVADIMAYLELLGPPPRSSTNPALETQGEGVFASVGCATCHTPSLATSDGTPVPLYSDLLLHTTVPASYPGIASGAADPHEFRTAPLWGIAKTAPYMHHGRATTIEDAIAEHDGEAAASRDAVARLPTAERQALLAFLQSL